MQLTAVGAGVAGGRSAVAALSPSQATRASTVITEGKAPERIAPPFQGDRMIRARAYAHDWSAFRTITVSRFFGEALARHAICLNHRHDRTGLIMSAWIHLPVPPQPHGPGMTFSPLLRVAVHPTTYWHPFGCVESVRCTVTVAVKPVVVN